MLLYLKGPTEALPECRACWICQDVKNDHALIYLVQWDSQEDLEDAPPFGEVPEAPALYRNVG